MKKIHIIFFILCCHQLAVCQWSNDPSENSRVSTIGLSPKMVTNGSGGAYILYKNMPVEFVQLYVQRLDKYGYQKFPGNGVMVSDSNRYQEHEYYLIYDEKGGVIVSFVDVVPIDEWHSIRNIYVQRIDSTGQKLWGDDGIAVTFVDHANLYVVSLCADGHGGCYVFWGYRYDRNHKELWIQHLDSQGYFMWDSSGVLVTDQFVSFDSPVPGLSVTDGDNGTICYYYDSTGTKLQRIDSDGNFLWGDGIIPFPSGGWINMKDYGSNGVILAETYRIFYDYDIDDWRQNIRVQRVDTNGNLIWDKEGIVVIDSLDDRTKKPELVIDKLGNTIILWHSDMIDGEVYVQRIDDSGNLKWKKNGNFITTVEFGESNIVTNMNGGAILIWNRMQLIDGQTSSTLFGKHIDFSGNELWSSDIVISSRTRIHDICLISDEKGGAIVCWYETPPEIGIRAQQISKNGNLGEVITTNLVELNRAMIPHETNLFQNYPNPFNSETIIKYQLHESSLTQLIIYDINGKEVIELVNRKQQPGEYQVIWNGKNQKGGELSSGIYFILLKTENFRQIIKSLFIK